MRPSRVTQVLGIELPWSAMEGFLVSIGATLVPKPEDDRIAVEVPSWRPDLLREIDLVEEIARLHGYQNFPDTLRPFRPGLLQDAPIERAASLVRRGLAEQGLFEVMPLPTSPVDGSDSVRLVNPLSRTEDHLRRRLLPGLIRLVQHNWDNHVENIRLFELGTVFSAAPAGERPGEERHVAAVLTGRREPAHWTGTGESRIDLWDLKGQFEVAVGLAIPGGAVQLEGNGWVARDSAGRTVGHAGLIPADAPPWAAPLYGYELLLDPAPREPTRFADLPSTPSSERVLALLLPEGTSVRQVEQLLRKSGGPLLEAVSIESDYRGSELPPGTRSVAFRLTFRAPDRTLRDTETDTIETRMLASLTAELGIQRRVVGVTGGGE